MQKFNYHSHTNRCGHADINYTDEEYVEDYIKMGFKRIAFTDHCPQKERIDRRMNIRMDYRFKDNYLNAVNELKDKYKDKIEIKSGFEIEYLPGQEENLKELKNESDFIVLGQHFVYRENGKDLAIMSHSDIYERELDTYAEYIDTAMKLKLPNYVAHPDIFMMSRKEFGQKEREITHKICKSAQKYHIPLEINLNNIFGRTYNIGKLLNDDPFKMQVERLENVKSPNKEFWEIVSGYNIDVIYGLDTHYRGQIPRFNDLVKLANLIIGEETVKKLHFIDM